MNSAFWNAICKLTRKGYVNQIKQKIKQLVENSPICDALQNIVFSESISYVWTRLINFQLIGCKVPIHKLTCDALLNAVLSGRYIKIH